MLVITFFGGLFFGSLNWVRGIFVAAVIEFAFAAFCVVAFPLVRKTQYLQTWTLAIVLPWIAAVWMVVSLPDASSSVFIWGLVLPILLMLLLGRRVGMLLSIIALLGIVVIAAQRFGLPQNPDQIAYTANLAIAALAILVLSYTYERAREKAELNLHHLAVTDTLTDLPNRTLLYDNFARLKALALRQKTPLSLMLMDLDNFKQVNDRYGHDAGDHVLRETADLLRKRLRKSDQVYRMGGEEFLVLMPDTSLEQATRLAEELRRRIEAVEIRLHNQPIPLTTSIGITQMTGPEESFDSLLRRADQNMYWCKENGRNQIRAS